MYFKIIFLITLVISLTIHHFVFFALCGSANKKLLSDNSNSVMEKAVTMKIDQKNKSRGEKPRVKTSPPEKLPSAHTKLKKKVSIPSQKKMEEMGRAMIEKAKKGEFPPLTIQYRNPERYLIEMTDLGARLAVFDEDNQRLWEVALPGWITRDFQLKDLCDFGPFKRVIKDDVFLHHHISLAKKLGLNYDNTQLVLLVPLKTEAQWMGRQLFIFRKMGVSPSQVALVKAVFSDGRLKIKSLTLTDGDIKTIEEKSG